MGIATSVSCPTCQGPLHETNKASVECSACDTSYASIDGVLVLDQSLATKERNQDLVQLGEDARNEGWREAVKKTRRSARWLIWPGQATPLLALDIPQGGKVLDLGCGAGARAFGLACAGYNVVGVDPLLSLLHFAQARAEQEKLDKQLNFLACKPESFTAPTSAFDMVIVERPSQEILTNATKWLRPNGVLVSVASKGKPSPTLAGDPLWRATHASSGIPASSREIKKWLRANDLKVQASLICLPSWSEPNNVARLGHWPSLKRLLQENRQKLNASQATSLKFLALIVWLLTPLFFLFPALARLFGKDLLVVATQAGTDRTHGDCSFFAQPPALLLSNHASATWQADQKIIRSSLGNDTASREGALLLHLNENLPTTTRDSIPQILNVDSPTSHFGRASYEVVKASPSATPPDDAVLLAWLKDLAQIEAPQNQVWCKTFETMSYICFDIASKDFELAIAQAKQHLPLSKVSHGDFHKDNLLQTANGFVAIDWESAGKGHPWFDWIRYRVREQGESIRVNSAQAGIAQMDSILKHDEWTRELFSDSIPESVRELVLYFVFLSEDFTAMKELHLKGVPKGMAMLGDTDARNQAT